MVFPRDHLRKVVDAYEGRPERWRMTCTLYNMLQIVSDNNLACHFVLFCNYSNEEEEDVRVKYTSIFGLSFASVLFVCLVLRTQKSPLRDQHSTLLYSVRLSCSSVYNRLFCPSVSIRLSLSSVFTRLSSVSVFFVYLFSFVSFSVRFIRLMPNHREIFGDGTALWARTGKNTDWSTGPLVRSLARSLAPLTHSLAPHYSLHSRAPLCSLACLLAHFAHSLTRGKVHDWMAIFFWKWGGQVDNFWTIVDRKEQMEV